MMAKFTSTVGCLLLSLPVWAQYSPPSSNHRHLASVNLGFDHSLIAVNVGYGYYLEAIKSAPFLEITQTTALPGLANYRVQAGIKSWQGSAGQFTLTSQASLGWIQASNKAGNYQALAAVVELNPGWLLNRFGVGLTLHCNPTLATHIRHSGEFRNDFYAEAKDGWYKITSTNLRAGAYLLYLVGKQKSLEVNLKGGYQTSGSLDQLIPPLYFLLGCNQRF